MVDVDLLGLLSLCDLIEIIETATGRPIHETPVLLGHAARLHALFATPAVTARNAQPGEQLDLLRPRADGWAGVVDGDWQRIGAADGSPSSRRETDFPGGYPKATWDTLAQRHTDEGREQGRTPMRMRADGTEEPIPHNELTWIGADGDHIDTTPRVGPPPRPNGNLTFDHRTPCAQMWVEGANVTVRGPDGQPRIGSDGQPETRTYRPGHNTDYDERQRFYEDPDNIVPMSASENSGKGSEATDPATGDTRRYRYDEAAPGPKYSN